MGKTTGLGAGRKLVNDRASRRRSLERRLAKRIMASERRHTTPRIIRRPFEPKTAGVPLPHPYPPTRIIACEDIDIEPTQPKNMEDNEVVLTYICRTSGLRRGRNLKKSGKNRRLASERRLVERILASERFKALRVYEHSKKIAAFVPNDGCLNYIEENAEPSFVYAPELVSRSSRFLENNTWPSLPKSGRRRKRKRNWRSQEDVVLLVVVTFETSLEFCSASKFNNFDVKICFTFYELLSLLLTL